MEKIHSTLRENDEKQSIIVSNYLDKKFFSKMKNVERVNDRPRQVQGIDIIFTRGEETYICDEKAAIQYINKPLNTFSFELSFLNRAGNLQNGWLIDEHKVNDSYMIIWIDEAKVNKDGYLESEADIKKLQISLIKRNKIIDYLLSLGWTFDKLLKKSELLRTNDDEDKGSFKDNGIRFYISNQLVEKPVNVLLTRKKIEDLSELTIQYYER